MPAVKKTCCQMLMYNKDSVSFQSIETHSHTVKPFWSFDEDRTTRI